LLKGLLLKERQRHREEKIKGEKAEDEEELSA